MKTPVIMRITLLALLPGLLAFCWFYGLGVAINVSIAMLTAVIVEALMLSIRGKPWTGVYDGSALLTGALLGLCMPPLLPLWLVIAGVTFGIVFGKQIYGGTGQNIFNPAMIGFAMLIVSFPLAMSYWPAPDNDTTITQTLQIKAGISAPAPDAVTAATPLDAYRLRQGQTNDEFFSGERGATWETWLAINLAFLAGGIVLIYLRVIPWQTPCAFIATLVVLSIAFFDSGSSASLGSPVFQLFSGATMLAAFFIITDPVTCPGYKTGLVVFGIGIGLITFVIRSIGAYPEGIAFAVLLMNALSPLIDHVLSARPRTA